MNKRGQDISELIDQAKTGDSEAVGELLERYRSFLTIKVAREIAVKYRKRFDPADVVQIAFVDASKDIANFRGTTEREFSGWIQKILENKLNNVFRDNAALKRAVNQENTWRIGGDGQATSICWMDPDAQTATPSQRVIQGERALQIASAIDQLPDSQRIAVRMRHLEGMKLEEIAEHLDRSLSATAGLIKRGISTLRELLADMTL